MKIGFWINGNSALWQDGEIIASNDEAMIVVGYAASPAEAVVQLREDPEFIEAI